MKNGAAACSHNEVDAEALLRFSLNALCETVDRLGARELLRQKLAEFASRNVEKPRDHAEGQEHILRDRINELERKKTVVKNNFLSAEDPELRAEAEKAYCEHRSQIDILQRELLQITKSKSEGDDPNREVDKAMALFDTLHRGVAENFPRAEMPGLFDRLGIKIGLHFVEVPKKTRRVMRLAGGILALGNIDIRKGGDSNNVDGQAPSIARKPDLAAQFAPLPALAAASNNTPREEISSTKVNRGDRIRTCDLLTPSQAR